VAWILVFTFAVVSVVFAAENGEPEITRSPEAARLMGELMAGKVPVGTPFALRDASGRLRTLQEFRGKLVLLYFGYTGCPDVCPTDLAFIGAALRSLGAKADAVQPVFVTLDPARDTPEVLREYVTAFDVRFVALRGSEDETRHIARAWKVYYEKVPQPGGAYFIDHTAFTFVLDRHGRYTALFPPGTSADRMVTMLRDLLEAP
jgi:protein SCO1/2